jgi:hypothetical protein
MALEMWRELKSSDFGLSQALAYGVVRKGVCGDFNLCGLAPCFDRLVSGAQV